MPSPDELDELGAAADDVRAVMVAALVSYWMENVQGNPADSVDELREFVIDLVAEYGLVAAATAIDFYDSVRPAGSPPFRPVPALPDDLLGVGTLNWSTEPLLGEDWQTSLDRIAASIMKAAQQALVETIGQATEDDPLDVRFARWPRNSDPCAWCVLRASRGAIYWSEASAESGDHLKCGCAVTPIFPGEPLPYQRKPYYAQYEAGLKEADGPGRKALLSGMRRANGIR